MVEFNVVIDLGDLVEMIGYMGVSKIGILLLIVSGWCLIGKCLWLLLNKWKGLLDFEV